MKILYVTTFNEKIFNATGNKMINSFLSSGSEGDMLVCPENFKFRLSSIKRVNSSPDLSKRFHVYDIAKSKFLKSWLSENNDVIHPEMGGAATIKRSPGSFLPWNVRAAGWFRKIVSLDYALNEYYDKYDCIIFVDSDCSWVGKIDSNLIEKAFAGTSFFYHWGREREKKMMGVESGFVGFRCDKDGTDWLTTWINKFRNKTFRMYMRWDDGGMLGYVVRERADLTGSDLVKRYNDNGKSQSHVIERGMFAKYIVHNKGVHKRVLGIKEK